MLFFCRKPVDLNRYYERIGVCFHANESLICIRAESCESGGEVSEVVIFFKLFQLVLVIEVGNKPVLCVFKNVGADTAYFLGCIDDTKMELRSLFRQAVVYFAEVFICLLRKK